MKRAKQLILDIITANDRKAAEITEELQQPTLLSPHEDAYLHGMLAAIYQVNTILREKGLTATASVKKKKTQPKKINSQKL